MIGAALGRGVEQVRRGLVVLPHPAKPALSGGEGGDGKVEGLLVEVGPEGLSEVELRVGELPEQEVADPLFSAGAYQEIGLGCVVHGQVRRQVGLGEVPTLLAHAPVHGVRGLDDVPPSSVVGGDGEGESGVLSGEPLRVLDLVEELPLEWAAVTDHLQADVELVHLGDLPPQDLDEEAHEEGDLVRGPSPVLAAEGEDGDELDAKLDGLEDHVVQDLGAALMPCDPRQESLTGPSAVPVHDHGDVPWHGSGLGERLARTEETFHLACYSFLTVV